MSFVERLSSFRGYFVQSVYRVHLVCPLLGGLSSFGGYFVQSVYRVHLVCPLLGGLSSFGGYFVQSIYRVHLVCPLLGGLSSFGVHVLYWRFHSTHLHTYTNNLTHLHKQFNTHMLMTCLHVHTQVLLQCSTVVWLKVATTLWLILKVAKETRGESVTSSPCEN